LGNGRERTRGRGEGRKNEEGKSSSPLQSWLFGECKKGISKRRGEKKPKQLVATLSPVPPLSADQN